MIRSVIDWNSVVKLLPQSGVFVALLGLLITMLMTWWTHRQRATFEMIDRMYSLCHTLHTHLLKEWRLIHLFSITEDAYWKSRSRIDRSFSIHERSELIEKERLLAIHIFIAYEQVFFHRLYTSLLLYQRRAFLDLMLSYFTDRVLNNPRLKAIFEADTTGRSLHLEEASAEYLKDRIAKSRVTSDSAGPFS